MMKKKSEKELLEKLKQVKPIYANIKSNDRDIKKLYFQTQSSK